MTVKQVENLVYKYNREVAALLNCEVKTITVNANWRALKTHGRCSCRRDALASPHVSIANDLVHDADIHRVILHEICHVYAGVSAGHGWWWRRIADEVQEHYGVPIKVHDDCEHRNAKDKLVATLTCPECGKVNKLYSRNCGAYKHPERYQCHHCGGKTLGKLVFNKIK